MMIEYDVVPGDAYVSVCGRGEMRSVKDIAGYAWSMINDVLKTDSRKVLLDDTGIIGEMNTIDGYDAAVSIANEFGRARTIRCAIVPSAERMQGLRFFETVARNRGLMVRVFATTEEAENWLIGDAEFSFFHVKNNP